MEERSQRDWEAKKKRVFEELGGRVAGGDRALSEMRGSVVGKSTLAVSSGVLVYDLSLILRYYSLLSAQTYLSTCKQK